MNAWKLQEIFNLARRNPARIAWLDSHEKVCMVQKDFEHAGRKYWAERKGHRVADMVSFRTAIARELYRDGLILIADGSGCCDHGLVNMAVEEGKKKNEEDVVLHAYRPWTFSSQEEPQGIDGIYLKVRLTNHVQILAALDSRRLFRAPFYLPFGSIQPINHGIEGEPVTGNLPTLVIYDPQ